MSNGANSPEVDKESLYQQFLESVRWKRRVDEKLACMSLDLPMDDNTNITQYKNVKNGWGWKEMAVAGGLGLGMYGLAARESPSVPPPPAPIVAADHQDLDTTRSVVIKPRRPSE